MSGMCYKGRLEGLDIAVTYTDSFEIVNKAVVLHDCDPAAAHLLGRCMTAAIMTASLLPEKQRINVSWRYPGSLKTIVVDAGQDGATRGMISPSHLGSAADNQALYGDIGSIQVVRTERGKVLNSGTTPVSLHDPVSDLAYYFSISDQVETALRAVIALKPDVESPVSLSHGIMMQALPGCDLERLDRIRNRMQSESFLRDIESELSPRDIQSSLEGLAQEEEALLGVVLEEAPAPYFSCNCSQEKMVAVMRSIPIPDRMAMVKKGEDIRIRCQFCAQLYTLSIEKCIKAWNTKAEG